MVISKMTTILRIFLFLVAIQTISSQQLNNVAPVIPDYLLECYSNSTLYNRENRLPSNLGMLIEIIRKIENYQVNRGRNAREVAIAIIHTMKMDGIRQATPDILASDTIVPYAPTGLEYYNHRFILVNLVKNTNSIQVQMVIDALTVEQKCSLHFMVSHSIDMWYRGDEGTTCSSISSNYRRRTKREEEEGGDEDETKPNKGKKGRKNRRLQKKHNANRKHRKNNKKLLDEEEIVKTAERRKREIMQEVRRDSKSTLHAMKLAPDSDKKREASKSLKNYLHSIQRNKRERPDVEKDAEMLPPDVLNDMKKPDSSKLGNFSSPNTRNVGPLGSSRNKITTAPPQPLLPARGTPERPESVPPGQEPLYNTGVAGNARLDTSNYKISDCPLENGVIDTGFGAVAIGTVITGIAAGYQPVDLPIIDLLKPETRDQYDSTTRVNNLYASTLAGKLAETVLLNAMDVNRFGQSIGVSGGWNNTITPRHYFMKNNNVLSLTDASLRGALDGLWLANEVPKWTANFDSLKLSQILNAYYSSTGSRFNREVKASNRAVSHLQYAPTKTVEEQTAAYSEVMAGQSITTVTFQKDSFITYAPKIVATMDRYIPSMDPQSAAITNDENIYKYINLIVAIDTSWPYESFMQIINLFMNNKIMADEYHANVTIIGGNDNSLIFNKTNEKSGILVNLTKNYYESFRQGFDIMDVLDNVEVQLNMLKNYEKSRKKASSMSNVILLMPYAPNSDYDSSYLTENKDSFNNTFPESKFLLAKTGSSTQFQEILDTSEDSFMVTSSTDYNDILDKFAPVMDRIAEEHHRISVPHCSSHFTETPERSEMEDFIQQTYVRYYKMVPNYFFSATNPKVTVQGFGYGPIEVCYSRTNDRPKGSGVDTSTNRLGVSTRKDSRLTASTEDTTCKTITSDFFDIQMPNPCSGKDRIKDCNPLYVSINGIDQPDQKPRCSDPGCEQEDNYRYVIRLEGFQCKSGVARLIFNPIMLAVIIIVAIFNR